jgi:hypothetical protein
MAAALRSAAAIWPVVVWLSVQLAWPWRLLGLGSVSLRSRSMQAHLQIAKREGFLCRSSIFFNSWMLVFLIKASADKSKVAVSRLGAQPLGRLCRTRISIHYPPSKNIPTKTESRSQVICSAGLGGGNCRFIPHIIALILYIQIPFTDIILSSFAFLKIY